MFRQVDIEDQTPVEVAQPGTAPVLEWVEIARLLIDDSYQRPINSNGWKVIRQIARGFDWAKFTPVICAPHGDGQLALMDGQHRAHAAAMAGLDRIPAMIVDIPPDRQAAAFLAINSNRVAVTPFHIYRAALAAGEVWAHAADAMVRAGGCRLMTSYRSARQKKPGEIYAITLIQRYVKSERGRVVTQVLKAIRDSGHGEDVGMYQSRVLTPLMAVIDSEPPVDDGFLTQFVSDANLLRARDTVGNLRERPEYARLSDGRLAEMAFRALLHQAQRDAGVRAA